jgi:hypothetical protein
MVRSQKSIGGAVEVALGNAPYKIAIALTAEFSRHRESSTSIRSSLGGRMQRFVMRLTARFEWSRNNLSAASGLFFTKIIANCLQIIVKGLRVFFTYSVNFF